MQKIGKTAAAALVMLSLTIRVFAADLPQPQEVIRGHSDKGQTVEKIYVLSNTEDGSIIPTDSFTEDKVRYTFADLKKEDNMREDVREYTESVAVHTNTNDTQTVISQFTPKLEISTEDGYMGMLALDYTTLKVTSAGTGTQSYTVTENRSYPNLQSADTSLVPKTISKDGAVLNLTNISWQSSASDNIDGQDLAVRYTANAEYSGTGTKTYSKGYTASAQYKGEVRKPVTDTVTYRVLFQEEPQEKKNHPLSNWWLYLIGAAAISSVGSAAYVFIRKRKKGYR